MAEVNPDGRIKKAMSSLMGWVDERFPLTETFEYHMSRYYAPKNFNFLYYFGWLATVVFIMQILTGIWLTMNYVSSGEGAFASVEFIMRDVDWGWLMRYLHSTGASFFFIVVYLHMYRALMYGSYRGPRELLWLIGMVIFIVLMAEGFAGYLLPWGNMSYWGAQVILSLAGAIPIVGEDILIWVRGDYLISGATLSRMFAIHVILIPLLLAVLVFVHFVALHHVGSNNPDGIEIKKNKDKEGIPIDSVPFHPYYTVHDIHATVIFLFIFFAVVFFAPEMGGFFLEKPNFIEANPLVTPEHIAPVWYYTPYYSMLRAVTYPFLGIDAKLWGLIVMGGAILIPAALPWLDKSPVKSMRYKGTISKVMLVLLVVSFVVLGYLGVKSPTPGRTLMAQIGTLVYFAYFVLMPWYTRVEKTKPEPERVTT